MRRNKEGRAGMAAAELQRARQARVGMLRPVPRRLMVRPVTPVVNGSRSFCGGSGWDRRMDGTGRPGVLGTLFPKPGVWGSLLACHRNVVPQLWEDGRPLGPRPTRAWSVGRGAELAPHSSPGPPLPPHQLLVIALWLAGPRVTGTLSQGREASVG